MWKDLLYCVPGLILLVSFCVNSNYITFDQIVYDNFLSNQAVACPEEYRSNLKVLFRI
jgi:hypothetical protein